MPDLVLQDLATPIVGPVSLGVADGSCTAMLGPSGAGKSLLLRAIADLDPNTGTVRLGDHAREAMPARDWRKLVALVPAESGWWADRVRDHFPTEGANEHLREVGLADALDWEVARLSTGERQRLALARALARRPRALLLDEPTAALNREAVELVEAILRRQMADGVPVLMVTHDPDQAGRLADRIVTMHAGRLAEEMEARQ